MHTPSTMPNGKMSPNANPIKRIWIHNIESCYRVSSAHQTRLIRVHVQEAPPKQQHLQGRGRGLHARGPRGRTGVKQRVDLHHEGQEGLIPSSRIAGILDPGTRDQERKKGKKKDKWEVAGGEKEESRMERVGIIRRRIWSPAYW